MEDEPKHPDVAAIFTRLLSELRLSPTQFAKSLEPQTTQQTIQTYTSGKRAPGSKLLASIIKKYPAINAVWLMTGEGEPFPNGRFGKKEPMVPGGEVNERGNVVRQPGTIKAAYGKNFGEDEDGKTEAAPVTTHQEFIKSLLVEIDGLKKEVRSLNTVITEQRDSMKDLRENNQFLREQVRELQSAGKLEGNQLEAPGTMMEPRAEIGFGRGVQALLHDEPTNHPCVVRCISTAPAEVVHGESEDMAA